MNPLQIYRKHPSAPDTYYIGGGWSPACITAVEKRFTDAELLAEYWAQDSQCRKEQWIETVRGEDDYTDTERAGQSLMYARLNTLYRFATLPHASEVPE